MLRLLVITKDVASHLDNVNCLSVNAYHLRYNIHHSIQFDEKIDKELALIIPRRQVKLAIRCIDTHEILFFGFVNFFFNF
jgi:hypothetical protein